MPQEAWAASPLLPLCWAWGSHSARQAWQQAPLPTDSSLFSFETPPHSTVYAGLKRPSGAPVGIARMRCHAQRTSYPDCFIFFQAVDVGQLPRRVGSESVGRKVVSGGFQLSVDQIHRHTADQVVWEPGRYHNKEKPA